MPDLDRDCLTGNYREFNRSGLTYHWRISTYGHDEPTFRRRIRVIPRRVTDSVRHVLHKQLGVLRHLLDRLIQRVIHHIANDCLGTLRTRYAEEHRDHKSTDA